MSEFDDFIDMLEEEFGEGNVEIHRLFSSKQYDGDIDQYGHLLQYEYMELANKEYKVSGHQSRINNYDNKFNLKYKIGIDRG